MPALRPTGAVRAARSSLQTTTHPKPAAAGPKTRSLSTTSRRAGGAASRESKYDPPTGWLFGVKPGEKYKPEGWEKPFYWGFCGSLIVTAIILPFTPDTSIQTWALEEARRRLEAEGILEDPYPEKKN